jgi:vacuolar protein sorting-associated protein 18
MFFIINSALTSYSTKIDSFLKEMSDCDQTCDTLRGEIGRLRNHAMQMRTDARCAFTNKAVLGAGEAFYVFPSGYVVLVSAIKKEVMPYLNEKQRARVEELEKVLQRSNVSSKETVALQRELDGLLAAECPLTGSVMVESIDKDFDGSEEFFDDSNYHESSIERLEV